MAKLDSIIYSDSCKYDDEPYRALWCAVIVQALKDLARRPTPKMAAHIADELRLHRDSAYHWFMCDDMDSDNGFVTICELLGGEVELFREIAKVAYETGRLPRRLQYYIKNKKEEL